MRTIATLLFSMLLLTFAACEEKKKLENHFTQEIETNITTIFTQKDLEKHTSDVNHSQYPHTFTLESTQKKYYTFSMLDKNIYSKSFHKKTIVLNISHISSPSSFDQMESLSKLQRKYQSKLIVISLLLGDTQKISTPNIFLNKHHIYHFVSFSKENEVIANLLYTALHTKDKPIPLTVIYKEEKYYSHFEGAAPIEMITHDIKQTIKK
ncbi:MAG: hypothetical protein L3J43_02315 [Sulfurovum sp.]|nr:hypothetical protein [Sulfurovum sp.]